MVPANTKCYIFEIRNPAKVGRNRESWLNIPEFMQEKHDERCAMIITNRR